MIEVGDAQDVGGSHSDGARYAGQAEGQYPWQGFSI